jgi:response regulator NasT
MQRACHSDAPPASARRSRFFYETCRRRLTLTRDRLHKAQAPARFCSHFGHRARCRRHDNASAFESGRLSKPNIPQRSRPRRRSPLDGMEVARCRPHRAVRFVFEPRSTAWNRMTEPSLRILVVDPDSVRASIVEDGLREAGYENVTIIRDMENLLRRIVDADPEVIFIDLENPNRDVLEQMFQVSRCVHRPIAMFVDESDSRMIEAAVEAGVGAYVVDGLRKERIRSILDMAVSRFNAFSRLQGELDRTRAALEERKLVERAKGILMKMRGIDEAGAYEMLRKAAMNENRRICEVAQSVVTASRLLR